MPLRFLRVLAFFFLAGGAAFAAKYKWDPLDAKELGIPAAGTTEADAEFLFARFVYEGNDGWSEFTGYCRVKVNTEKGVADSRKLEIKLNEGESAASVEARIHRRDGSIYELKETDFIHSRDKKRNTSKEGKITFVLPDLSPGEILEYAWKTRRDHDVWIIIFDAQHQLPIRSFSYRFIPGFFKRLIFVANTNDAKMKGDGDEVSVLLENLAPFVEEPQMPAKSDYSVWLGMVPVFEQRTAKELWDNTADTLYTDFKNSAKPNGAIKEAAAAIVAGAADPKEKLRKIYDFCQREIINITYDKSAATEAVRKKRASETGEGWSAKEVLKRKMGYRSEILALFGALTNAVDLKGEVVSYPPATLLRNIRTTQGWCFLSETTLLFQFGEERIFCSPDDPYLPFGMRPWTHETATALIARPKTPSFTVIPVSAPEETRIDEKVVGGVDEEGTLSVSVTREFSGQEAWDMKTDRNWQTQDEFNREYSEDIHTQLPHAEITEMVWTNLTTRDLPLRVTYKMRVPNYAELIGSRMTLPLNPLRAGSKNPFTATTRKYPILFKKTEHTVTQVELTYPETFKPDNPTQPQSAGSEKSAVSVGYSVQLYPKKRMLSYKRDYVVGRGPGKEFPAEVYPAFKQLFDLLDRGDNHVVVLKPVESESTPATTAVP